MITVAGVGPGGKEYLTEKVAFIVQKADIVAGWNHALKVIEGVIHQLKLKTRTKLKNRVQYTICSIVNFQKVAYSYPTEAKRRNPIKSHWNHRR